VHLSRSFYFFVPSALFFFPLSLSTLKTLDPKPQTKRHKTWYFLFYWEQQAIKDLSLLGVLFPWMWVKIGCLVFAQNISKKYYQITANYLGAMIFPFTAWASLFWARSFGHCCMYCWIMYAYKNFSVLDCNINICDYFKYKSKCIRFICFDCWKQ